MKRPLPGDELKPNPRFLATHAITIDATPEAIWPCLLQMGYRRAGFYGYDILENIGALLELSALWGLREAFRQGTTPILGMITIGMIWQSDTKVGLKTSQIR